MHVLFHTCGILFEHHDKFEVLLNSGTSLGGLGLCIIKNFTDTTGIVELQVLGIIGKLITGTWIKLFYTSHMNQIEPVDGIQGLKEVLIQLKALKD